MPTSHRAAYAGIIVFFSTAAGAGELPPVSDPTFTAFLPSFTEDTERFVRGDAALWKKNAAHTEDALIMGAWGGY